MSESLPQELYAEICKITLIDPHSHINPHQAASKSLDDILGYHYYTELAHSAGMDKKPLAADFKPRERVRAILAHMNRFDNTVQYQWFEEIARTLLGYQGERLSADDCDSLCDTAERLMAQPDWEEQVLKASNIEKVFLTNDFDDTLEGFDTRRYVPCLRTDDLVFHLDKKEVRDRLARAADLDVGTTADLRRAVLKLFDRFTRKGARACAISLPPDFAPQAVADNVLDGALQAARAGNESSEQRRQRSAGIFWILAEHCRQFRIPFDLMIGVNRRVYEQGVFQGQDLFDQRTSLIQYKELFNAFPDVTFCISVLTSSQNQELASYSWIFPNVVTSGHWWYSNIPVFVEHDARARLQAVPKTKQLGYYSDMYKLEFGLPKFNMYRRILARILANDFVRDRGWKVEQALDLARLVLRDNVKRIFNV
ncbi:MAG: glucuronate isomerase [Gemmataceae bacterium]